MRLFAELPLPAFYREAEVLAYHGRDGASLTERVEGARILKPLRLAAGPALVAIDLGSGTVATLAADRPLDPREVEAVLAIARRMLGLTADAAGLERIAEGDGVVARLVSPRPGLRLPLTANAWEAMCWAVIGQQINLTFAAALRREMVDLAGARHGETGWRLHPTPAEIAALAPEALTARRFSRAKAAYLIGVARAVTEGTLDLDALVGLPAEQAEERLVALRGIGRWTARYVMLRGLGHGDVAPVGDSGLATALQRLHGIEARPDMAAQEVLMQPFAPFRSLATAHLWASLAPPLAGDAGR